MSNYKGHLAGGLAAFGITLFVVTKYTNPSAAAMGEWLCFCLSGSLFPDIDIKSKGQKLFYTILVGVLGYFLINQRYDIAIILMIIAILPLLTRHRGLFHKTWFVVAAPIFIAIALCGTVLPACQHIIFYDVIFFVMGALSHLWLDLGLKRMLKF